MARRPLKLVDLCKINTDAFRHMTEPQLKRAQRSIGTYLDFTKAELLRADGYGVPKKIERKARHNNTLLARFISELVQIRKGYQPLSPRSVEAYKRTYKEDPPDDTRIFEGKKREAARVEKAIWDLQMRAGCAIKGSEQVARDAERSGDKVAVARIRRKAIIR